MQPTQPQPELRPQGNSVERQATDLERPAGEPAAVAPQEEQTTTPPVASHNVQVPAQPLAAPASDDNAVTPAQITSPLAAADGDNIEPQWVDAVDDITEKNANDPYEQEEAAEDLSQKYLKERFGIDVNEAQ